MFVSKNAENFYDSNAENFSSKFLPLLSNFIGEKMFRW